MTSSYMISPGTTNEDLAIKRRLALALMQQGSDTSPVQHWTQGAARMLQGGLGGYEMYRAKEEDREETAKGNALLAAFLGGGQGATPVVPSAAPSPASVSMAPTSGKVYENNEPSPLDPPSGTDRDLLIRTVLAEAGNQGPVGMQAVANVARNRAVAGNFGGDTIPGVIQKPYQFEPHNTEAGRAKMAAIDPASPQYAAADAAVSRAYAGDDPTRGATHFYAPKTQAALGRSAPSWDNGTGVDIKDHRFFGGAGTPQVTAGASPTEVSAQSVRPQPAGVPNREALIQMLGNRKTAPIARQIIGQHIQQQFKPESTDEIKEYNLYSKQEQAAGRKPLPFYDYKTGLKRAGAIQNSVQIDQKGESSFSTEAGKLQAKRFNDLAEDAPAAKQMLSDVEMLRDLGTKIETGKGAEVRAAIGPYAQALGVDVKGLNEIQAYEAVVNRVAPNLRVKGSGAQSDFELRNFLKSIPSIGNTPGGNEIASRVLEGLYQNKIAAAEIGAKALNGEMTRAQAEKAIRDLPDPMKEWREFNKSAKKSEAASHDREALEAEMKRRGLLK